MEGLFRGLPVPPRRKPNGMCSTADPARPTAPCRHLPAFRDGPLLDVFRASNSLPSLSPKRQWRPISFLLVCGPTGKAVVSNSLRSLLFELQWVFRKDSTEVTPSTWYLRHSPPSALIPAARQSNPSPVFPVPWVRSLHCANLIRRARVMINSVCVSYKHYGGFHRERQGDLHL